MNNQAVSLMVRRGSRLERIPLGTDEPLSAVRFDLGDGKELSVTVRDGRLQIRVPDIGLLVVYPDSANAVSLDVAMPPNFDYMRSDEQ